MKTNQRQDWTDVLSPPPALAQRCQELVTQQQTHGALNLSQLQALVLDIAARPEIWTPLAVEDPHRRRYRLLFEDDRIDVWVLSWMPGQATGFHDHDHSSVALMCVQGCILEKQMRLPSGVSNVKMLPGTIRTGGPGYIHAVNHFEGAPAVSIHAYSPPLKYVGQFAVSEEGILERSIEHGRRELMDNTIVLD